MRCEVIVDDKHTAFRGVRMLRAMIAAAPIELRVREQYVGDCELLCLYGNGHPVRRPWWKKHLERGGHCIGFDLGYWKNQEGEGNCRMRVTLDADHPQKWIRPEPPERWDSEGIPLREDANPRGPVIIIGLGPKSNAALGMQTLQWESRAAKAAKAAWPNNEIVFKPKLERHPKLPGVRVVIGDIADVLKGASLLVCRHSNCAIDACIAGVPVVCDDGAAAALYGPDIAAPTQVTRAQRLEFLRSLAYWNWAPSEAKTAWDYLLSRLQT
jgi:hypothetical protein